MRSITSGSQHSRLWVLYFAIMVAGMGQTIVFAIVPMLGRELGLDQLVIDLPALGVYFPMKELAITSLTSVSSLIFFLTASRWGRKSDVVGRKPVMLIGLMGLGFGTFLFSFAAWLGLKGIVLGFALYVLLMLTRVVLVAIMSGIFPASNAYVVDISSLEDRTSALSKLAVANQVGTMVGPALAFFTAISFLAPLYIQASLAFLALLLVVLLIHPVKDLSPLSSRAKQKLAFWDSRYRQFLLVSFFMFLALAMVQQTLGFYFQDKLKLNAVAAAQTFSMAMVASSIATMAAQFLVVQRWKKHPIGLLKMGLPIAMLGYCILAFAAHLPLLIVGMASFGFGMGLAMPGCSVSATYTVSADEQGGLAGLNASVPAMGFVIGPLLGGWIYGFAPEVTYWAAALIIAVLMFLALRIKPSYYSE